MIYLDNSATTKPCEAAVAATAKAMTELWANPSALYNFGFDAAKELRQARNAVAAALGAEPDRIFFTSGGTEADNWAIMGTAKRFGKKNRHIVTTAIEHHAVLNTMKELFASNLFAMISAGMMTAKINDLKHRFDSSEHGGAPILGVRRPVIKAHGGSDAKAIKNAIVQAEKFVRDDVNGEIERVAAALAESKKQ